MSRLVPTFVAVVLVCATATPPIAHAAPCWQPPVDGVVVDPFREPRCPYCSGNRGIEYRVEPGASVTAVASGTVSWAGMVAGTRYLVVRHSDGRRATYGRLATSSPKVGDRVAAGEVVGTTKHDFYFGIRDGDRYIDPAPLLGEWRGRPRLVPIDGRTERPAPPARLRCGA